MKKATLLLLTCILLPAACTPASTAATTLVPVITQPSPTEEAPVESTPIPSLTLTELGVTDPALAAAFKGIEKNITREADGTYRLTAVAYENGAPLIRRYVLVGNFSLNADIKNDYSPRTVDAFYLNDKGEKVEVKLVWDREKKTLEEAFPMVADTNFSRVDEHPQIPLGKEKLAIESALLWFRDHPPFTDAAVESYKENGGNSLLFTFLEGNGKIVNLKSKGNDTVENLSKDKATMKFSDLWVYQIIDGVRQDMPLIVIFDPTDPENPQKDQYKILFGVGAYDFSNLTEENRQYLLKVFNDPNNFSYPLPVLYGDENYQKRIPLLAQLLALPGNDPSKLGYFIPALEYVDQLSSTNTPLETQYYTEPLPSKIQTMRLFFQLISKNPIN